MNSPESLYGLEETRTRARYLYWSGWSVKRIAEYIREKAPTVHSWKRRDGWEQIPPFERVTAALNARLIQLILKEAKEGKDFKEIDLLMRETERAEKIKGRPVSGDSETATGEYREYKRGKKSGRKNEISVAMADNLRSAFLDSIFDYQKVWHSAGQQNRVRNILKSRQIGATWYFAREALIDAIDTGRNQIFLSASKAQAHVFKQYILEFMREQCDEELKGDPIILANGATLYFLGTNARTAQSYHGNLYFDEYFWTSRFAELRKVASGMAMHKKWRQTYFSTPSALTHEGYGFWTGALANRGRTGKDRLEIDVSHGALQRGLACADGQWRQIVTVEDALANGCDLFDLAQLKLEYSPLEYSNLLLCQFIDDALSVFPLAMLERCLVDSWEAWAGDFKPLTIRPFGHRPVWVGYDPAHTGDKAGLAVIAPPAVAGGKFRILERAQFHGLDFEAQAQAIKALTTKYHVGYIGIDATGVGQGVYQLVKQFFPATEAINYSPETKSAMVLKTYDVIDKGRLEYDAGWNDITQAFMAIRKSLTTSGQRVTYDAGRAVETGHADLAWAVMHAVSHEPLTGQAANSTGFMEIIT
ncbi:terminase large subunit domain-containing protein [Silvimonas sp.]|uniref:terminase large subunit domain-containing protein n=1 Tax=Silvimonas sp. TaxID=2650811 RepID=UPI00283F991F|nr:terminase family protein [Silvimonas sp.]MDR3429032.1 terminase family protein [Silvimonas sp.]